MGTLTSKLNISGKLYADLGFKCNNRKYNLDLMALEAMLDARKDTIVNNSNENSYKILSNILRKFNFRTTKNVVSLQRVSLHAWIDGQFDPDDNKNITLNIYFNKKNALTPSNWYYFKQQILAKIIHETVHFLRFYEDKSAYMSDDFHEYDIAQYLSTNEELYSYSFETIFELLTNSNRSAILNWYNKKVNGNSLEAYVYRVNESAKAPIFMNKVNVELI